MSIIVLGILGCFVLISGRAFYNLFFHPLCQVPGPPLARVTRLWARIGNFSGRKSERIHAAHEIYGPIVRVGPNELSFSSPAAVKEIYLSGSFLKEPSFYHSKMMLHENHMFSFRDPEAHKQRRKVLSRAFSQSSLLEFEPCISDKIETMLNQWAKLTKGGRFSVNADERDITRYLLIHLDHLLLDEDPESLKSGRPHEAMSYIRSWKPTFIYKEFLPALPTWGHLIPGPIGRQFSDVQKWKKLNCGLIRSARARSSDNPFLRHALVDEDKYLGRALNDNEIAEEVMGGMFGGSGTTANTFLFMVWAVAKEPSIAAKLKSELKQAFPDPNVAPDYTTCSNLPYLQATLNETLRRYPTIIATLPRIAVNDAVVHGLSVPKGTIVGTQNFTIHRDPVAFPNPELFEPERWLDSPTDSKNQNFLKEAFTPFSIGTRKCVGINLAYMELCKLAASFFRRFDVGIHSSMAEEEMRMYDNFSAAPSGGRLWVNLEEY